MRKVLHTMRWLLGGFLVVCCSMAVANAQERTLYQRLGGYDAIAAVVNDFAERLFTDPKLKTFFGGMSRDSQQRFKQLNVDLVCSATGGPCQYRGRPMPTSHQGMGITDADFDLVGNHLVTTLQQFKVPKAEQDALLAIIGGLRGQIVEIKK